MSESKRLTFHNPAVDGQGPWPGECKIEPDPTKANLVGSLIHCEDPFESPIDMHMPCIDIDLPCQLMPSTTPGHFHLYIDKELTFDQYRKLIVTMAEVGIVEPKIVEWMDMNGMTTVRLPGKRKPAKARSSGQED